MPPCADNMCPRQNSKELKMIHKHSENEYLLDRTGVDTVSEQVGEWLKKAGYQKEAAWEHAENCPHTSEQVRWIYGASGRYPKRNSGYS